MAFNDDEREDDFSAQRKNDGDPSESDVYIPEKNVDIEVDCEDSEDFVKNEIIIDDDYSDA